MGKNIVVYNSFLDSVLKLDSKTQKMVFNTIKQLSIEEKGNGINIHQLEKVKCDSTFKSCRINRDYRMILSHQGNKFILMHVDHHDDAYKWAEGKYLKTNNFGAMFVYDNSNDAIEFNDSVSNEFNFNRNLTSLLEKVNITFKDLMKLGINETHSKALMKIKDDNTFMEFISVFPEEIQEALMDIVDGSKDIGIVYNELTDKTVTSKKISIDEALNQKDTKRRFYVVKDIDDFQRIMDLDFERWKLFLHPKQEKLVSSNFYGPVLIEGGPGTGKTVVGIHRAVHLAEKVYPQKDNKRILLCTFSRKLSVYLERKVYNLALQKGVKNNIEVKGMDSLIVELLKYMDIYPVAIDTSKIRTLFKKTFNEVEFYKPLEFYYSEYEEVIQKYNIKTLEQYLHVDRKGCGTALNFGARIKVWRFFDKLLKEKEAISYIDYEDRAHLVYEGIKNGNIEPCYDSIIVDEAQDLSPVKIKILIGLLRTDKNNLMLLSDRNQRIFRLNSWRKDVNIDIVGRTYYLDLNYRTTREIKEYAENQFIESPYMTPYMRTYKSLFNGVEPEIYSFNNEDSHFNFIANKIKQLKDEGFEEHEICIALPRNTGKIINYFKKAGINYTDLKGDNCPNNKSHICISTIHGIKGLEFRAIILANYNNIGQTTAEYEQDWYVKKIIKQEECLKYVAATRAREVLILTYTE